MVHLLVVSAAVGLLEWPWLLSGEHDDEGCLGDTRKATRSDVGSSQGGAEVLHDRYRFRGLVEGPRPGPQPRPRRRTICLDWQRSVSHRWDAGSWPGYPIAQVDGPVVGLGGGPSTTTPTAAPARTAVVPAKRSGPLLTLQPTRETREADLRARAGARRHRASPSLYITRRAATTRPQTHRPRGQERSPFR